MCALCEKFSKYLTTLSLIYLNINFKEVTLIRFNLVIQIIPPTIYGLNVKVQ